MGRRGSITVRMNRELLLRLLQWNACMLEVRELALALQLCKQTRELGLRDHLLQRFHPFYVLIQKLLHTPVQNNSWYGFTNTAFTPMFVTREYGEEDWATVSYPFFGTLTSQQWAVYYAFWFYYATAGCAGTTCRSVDGQVERRIQMKVFNTGWLQQLPDSNGTLTFQSSEDALQLSFLCLDGQVQSMRVRRGCVAGPPEAVLPVPFDWHLFLRALTPMRSFLRGIRSGRTNAGQLSQLLYSLL